MEMGDLELLEDALTHPPSAESSIRLHLKHFRCFASHQTARIAPITILVGDNSTGKTTLLGASRMIAGLLDPDSIDFNREPFVLGSYNQIATAQEFRSKNKEYFSIGVEGRIRRSGWAWWPLISKDNKRIYDSLPQSTHYLDETKFEEGNGHPLASIISIGFGPHLIELDRPLTVGNGWQSDHVFHSVSTYGIGDDIVRIERGEDIRNKPHPTSLEHDFQGLVSALTRRAWYNQVDEYLTGKYGDDRPQDRSQIEIRDLDHYIAALRDELSGWRIYPIVPVRSSPERTYNPKQPMPEPSGDHIPMILSNMLQAGGTEWKRFKRDLSTFGQESGLFLGVNIRRFGGELSDPFQIVLNISGDWINVRDVGYGISQILPIIVDTLTQPTVKKFLFQQPEVHLHPRTQAALATFLIRRMLHCQQEFIVETHSDHIIDRIRIEVRDQRVDPRLVSLLYFERHGREVRINEIAIDELGNLVEVPQSYRKFFRRESDRLLGIGV